MGLTHFRGSDGVSLAGRQVPHILHLRRRDWFSSVQALHAQDRLVALADSSSLLELLRVFREVLLVDDREDGVMHVDALGDRPASPYL